jgi:uncharacterized protein (DUF885 family)
MAVKRVRAMGSMLDQAVERYRAGLAAGRTPGSHLHRPLLNQIDGYLDSPLDQDPFAHLAGPEDWDGEAAWRAELADAVTDHLRPAFARYRAVLADELRPWPAPDEHPACSWLPDGDDLYRSSSASTPDSTSPPRSCTRSGCHEVTEVLPAQYRVLGRRAFGTDDLAEIFRHLLDDPDLRYGDGDEILAHARSASTKPPRPWATGSASCPRRRAC